MLAAGQQPVRLPAEWLRRRGPTPHEDETHAEVPRDDVEARTDGRAAIGRGTVSSKEEDFSEVRFKDLPNAYKIGILGGTKFGKTYFFNALAYRLTAGEFAGALSYYRPSCELWEFPFSESGNRGPGKLRGLREFLESYKNWIPLKVTRMTNQRWYCLRTQFRSGWLGRSRSSMDIEFLDGSGEGFEADLGPLTLPTWETAFSDAKFMIFCLPIWAMFPTDHLSPQDLKDRALFLDGFDKVLSNYLTVKKKGLRVRTVLALTMADDRRCSLRLLRERWIDPMVEKTRTKDYLRQMRNRRGATRYLASARSVSNYLYRRLKSDVSDVFLHSNIEKLDLGFGPPTMIPVTALEGAILTSRQFPSKQGEGSSDLNKTPPFPAHVELPILAALCARYNILM